jgi:hypothetical protein
LPPTQNPPIHPSHTPTYSARPPIPRELKPSARELKTLGKKHFKSAYHKHVVKRLKETTLYDFIQGCLRVQRDFCVWKFSVMKCLRSTKKNKRAHDHYLCVCVCVCSVGEHALEGLRLRERDRETERGRALDLRPRSRGLDLHCSE